MRKHGTEPDYIKDRDRALLRAYRRVMDSPTPLYWREIIQRAVESPAERFWCSEEQATCIVRQMLAGKTPTIRTATKREMYEEIYRRVVELRKGKPDMTITDAVFKVVNSPAPKFYLTRQSAYVIIQRAKKECYEERKQRLRHFLLGQ